MNLHVAAAFFLLAAGSISPTIAATDCACERTGFPVCGSDSKTYSDECDIVTAKCADPALPLAVAYPGECLDSCFLFCPMDYDPKCGFDGTMYTQFPNRCELDMARCRAARDGKPLKKKACPEDKRVCGGKYYCGKKQACVLDNVRSVYYCAVMCGGKCKSNEVCVKQEDTACTSSSCPTKDACVPRINTLG